jgi:hypothetical protein
MGIKDFERCALYLIFNIRDDDLLQALKFLWKQFVLAKLLINKSGNIERISSALVNDRSSN